MSKIIRFNFEPDYDFMLFAVVSAVKDFKFAWNINAAFEMDFCKVTDLELNFANQEIKFISNYIFESEYSLFRILKNKLVSSDGENNGYLLPELKKFDYLIKIEGESVEEVSEGLPEKLKSLPCVQYFEKIKIENLKSKDNLLF